MGHENNEERNQRKWGQLYLIEMSPVKNIYAWHNIVQGKESMTWYSTKNGNVMGYDAVLVNAIMPWFSLLNKLNKVQEEETYINMVQPVARGYTETIVIFLTQNGDNSFINIFPYLFSFYHTRVWYLSNFSW
jgi:hypothetical protein